MHTIIIAAIAYIGGCFSPGIGRKLKALLAKGEADVKADIGKKL